MRLCFKPQRRRDLGIAPSFPRASFPPSDLRVDFWEPTNCHPTPPLCLAPALLTRARHLPGSDVPSPIVKRHVAPPPRCSEPSRVGFYNDQKKRSTSGTTSINRTMPLPSVGRYTPIVAPPCPLKRGAHTRGACHTHAGCSVHPHADTAIGPRFARSTS
ncbi:hypothetical protein BC826DRAFT_48373 [Russula brevipes]|nr:hypothetical protein BC826DRAFT_48373 [Russula brevipes]